MLLLCPCSCANTTAPAPGLSWCITRCCENVSSPRRMALRQTQAKEGREGREGKEGREGRRMRQTQAKEGLYIVRIPIRHVISLLWEEVRKEGRKEGREEGGEEGRKVEVYEAAME